MSKKALLFYREVTKFGLFDYEIERIEMEIVWDKEGKWW